MFQTRYTFETIPCSMISENIAEDTDIHTRYFDRSLKEMSEGSYSI
jgi:hypothetical protein